MTKMIDPTDPATAKLFERVDPAMPSHSDVLTRNRSCVPSTEADAIVAANENLDGCEQISSILEHWKPTEPQLCGAIAAHYGQSKRTIQKWFVALRDLAPWLNQAALRLEDDRYSPLAVDLLGERYFAGSNKNVLANRVDLRQQNAEVADLEQPAAESSGDRSSRAGFVEPLDLSLQPFDVPATSVEIVSAADPLTVRSLGRTNHELLQGRADVEAALLLVNQVNQLVQHTIHVDIEQSELEEQQVSQLEEAVFDLQVHKQCLQRQERASYIRRGYRHARRNRAQSRIVETRDFFAKRAGSPVPEVSQG